MKASFVVLPGLLTCIPAFAAGDGRVMRNWTSSDGKTLQAELLEFTDKDHMAPIERDRVVVAALKAIGGNTQFTELTGEGHNITGIVYGKHELHEWMFEQRRKAGPESSSADSR